MTDEKKDPNWKEDFPISRSEATNVTRREFAKFLCLVSGGLALGNLYVLAKGKEKRTKADKDFFVCKKEELPVGGTKTFVLEGSTIPYILIHLESGDFKAYEQKCTHLSCAVFYKPGTGKIECPCHNGWFDALTGKVLQGPPPRPLPHLDVIIKGEEVFVKYPQEKTEPTV